ncbi:hypothetical protein TWF217_009321 [Orbilia oligospora]|nr:hypothetical protein TWF217_009321 [Orbilia oligospora]
MVPKGICTPEFATRYARDISHVKNNSETVAQGHGGSRPGQARADQACKSTLLKRAFGMSDYVKTQTKISKPFGTWSPNPASLSSIVRVRGIDGCDLFFSISWTFVIVHAQVVLEAM